MSMDVQVPEGFHWFASSERDHVKDDIDDQQTYNSEVKEEFLHLVSVHHTLQEKCDRYLGEAWAEGAERLAEDIRFDKHFDLVRIKVNDVPPKPVVNL